MVSAGAPSWRLCLITSPVAATHFSGCTTSVHSQVCHVSFWGADLWLRPSWWMSTIQNPKKSWLAMTSACSLVDDTSLGPRLPLSGSGCPHLPVLPGDGPICSQLALLSPLFCERAWQGLQFSLVAQLCLTLCDPMNPSTPGLPVHHQLLEFTQTHVH